jgi:hypothetical protein
MDSKEDRIKALQEPATPGQIQLLIKANLYNEGSYYTKQEALKLLNKPKKR